MRKVALILKNLAGANFDPGLICIAREKWFSPGLKKFSPGAYFFKNPASVYYDFKSFPFSLLLLLGGMEFLQTVIKNHHDSNQPITT